VFILPELPYSPDALEPVLGGETLRTHHGKHHKKYVDTLNELLEAAAEKPVSLEAVIAAYPTGKVFNNAAQSWNHGFFWECMTDSYAAPSGAMASAIESYGGLAKLKADFVTEGVGHFASGWVWITADRSGGLKVISTHDAANALSADADAPILVCDLWEHAYYLDHKQDRKGFLEAWFDKLANWNFAADLLKAATSGSDGWAYPKPA
jgi:Fe-Mn family superoxide dismutase